MGTAIFNEQDGHPWTDWEAKKRFKANPFRPFRHSSLTMVARIALLRNRKMLAPETIRPGYGGLEARPASKAGLPL